MLLLPNKENFNDFSDLGGVRIENNQDLNDFSDLGGIRASSDQIGNADAILKAKTTPEILLSAYDTFSKMPPEEQKGLFSDIVNIAIKAPIAGASSILDFFSTHPLNAATKAANTFLPEGYQIPEAKSFEKKAEEGVDYISEKAGLDTTGGGKLYEGVKMASSVAVPGGIVKNIMQTPKVSGLLESLGSTNPKVLLGAAGAGAGMEAAKENKAGIAATLGSGLAGAVAAESLPFVLNKKNWADIGRKGLQKGLGLGKNQIKKEALDSAERLGIDLPASAATDSVVMAFVSQAISKIPFLGDKLRANVRKTSEQFQKAWDGMLDSIAPKIDQELSKEAKSIYKRVNNLLKNIEDDVSPSLILEKIKEIREFLKSPIKSESTKKLDSYMTELEKSLSPKQLEISASELPKGFERLSKEAQEQVINQIKTEYAISHIPVQEVLRAKIELNKIMRDRNLFDRADTDTLGFLNGIKSSVDATLAEYGRTNPKFFNALKEADKKYSGLAKRQNLEDVLSGKIINPTTQEVSYTPLIKILEDPSKQKFLKNNLGEANYKKLEDFVNVARSMDAVKRNVLNPSGTALVGGTMTLIQGLAFGTNIFPALTSLATASAATKLLTSKQFLNTAHQFAKTPTESLAKRMDKIVKDHTGVGIQALMKQSQKSD